MKTNLILPCALASFLLVCASAQGADETFKGTGMCAKCELKETKSCQNAIQVEKDGKKTTYYLEQNDVSKNFHKQICTTSLAVVATGSVKKDGDKLVLTASKIEAAK